MTAVELHKSRTCLRAAITHATAALFRSQGEQREQLLNHIATLRLVEDATTALLCRARELERATV
jgi:hypothetical protein